MNAVPVSLYCFSLSKCRTAVVRSAHDDVVRHAVFNAVDWTLPSPRTKILRSMPCLAVFITSFSKCSTAAVPRVHDDVVRHAVFNAVGCCQRVGSVRFALGVKIDLDQPVVHLTALCN